MTASPSIDKQLVLDVLASGLYDEAWYRSVYPDVSEQPLPAIEHYLRFGAVMGRSPGPTFDAARYLSDYPDVLRAGLNPLVHYLRHGRQEGRKAHGPHLGPAAIREATFRRPEAVLPLTALVITWDVGHNPLGRSYMLAEVLDRVVRNVVLAGFQFERYGREVWEPVRDGRLPVVRLRGDNFPGFLDHLKRVVARIRPDVVVACKPRLPSLQLGAMLKHATGCPLILDIDDHELSFFGGGDEIGVDAVAAIPDGASSAHTEPHGEMWTRLAQGLRSVADETIVSNVALQRVFGGTLVPHVRDETVFDPALHDREAARAALGIPADAKVVLFFGTPRQHKGIDVLAKAVGAIDDPSFRLVVVGSAPDAKMTAQLASLAPGRLIFCPNQPFSRIPDILATADVVCLPQDQGSPISGFQLPAKAIDAIAMGIPLLVAPTPPLMQLVEDGVAIAIQPDRLPQMLQEAAAATRPQAQVRERYLRDYSYAAASRTLRQVVNRAISTRDDSRSAIVPGVVAAQERLFGRRPALQRASGADIVMFWKQNDSGLYGRRSDMVRQYLSGRPDVRRILAFDAPISEHDLLRRRNHPGNLTHDRHIYTRTYERIFGELDTAKVAYDVFAFPPGRYRTEDDGSARPSLTDAWLAYVAAALEREGIDPQHAIFWFYPRVHSGDALITRFNPRKVVVDVVDDHRAWPGVSAGEKDSLTRDYRSLLGRADMAFANCRPVFDSMKAFAPAIRLVPNGCDEPVAVAQPQDAAFASFAAFPGKTIGFVGNLEKKVDIGLIRKIAARFPDCQVVLLGSTHANPDVHDLQRLPNVVMPGVVPYDEVGAWVSRFDVGTVPHLDMELTRSMNPLKLYVYLTWGVPVVSTEIHNLDRSTELLKVGASHEQFLAHVADFLANGKPEGDVFRRYIGENNWSARFKAHVDELIED